MKSSFWHAHFLRQLEVNDAGSLSPLNHTTDLGSPQDFDKCTWTDWMTHVPHSPCSAKRVEAMSSMVVPRNSLSARVVKPTGKLSRQRQFSVIHSPTSDAATDISPSRNRVASTGMEVSSLPSKKNVVVHVHIRDFTFQLNCGSIKQNFKWLSFVARWRYGEAVGFAADQFVVTHVSEKDGSILLPTEKVLSRCINGHHVYVTLQKIPTDDELIEPRIPSLWETYANALIGSFREVVFRLDTAMGSLLSRSSGMAPRVHGNFNEWGVPIPMKRENDSLMYIRTVHVPREIDVVFKFVIPKSDKVDLTDLDDENAYLCVSKLHDKAIDPQSGTEYNIVKAEKGVSDGEKIPFLNRTLSDWKSIARSVHVSLNTS
eukprot:176990_1